MSRFVLVFLFVFVLACELPEEPTTPTATPVPTATWTLVRPAPTASLRPTPTLRPAPTQTRSLATLAPAQSAGTGISLSDFKFGFEHMGPKFRSGSALDDNDRPVDYHVWDAPAGVLAQVEAWGPRSNLTKMRLSLGLEDPNQAGVLVLYMDMFMDSIFVDWFGSPWVEKNLDRVIEGGQPRTTQEGMSISMRYLEGLNWLEIMVEDSGP